MRWLLAFVVAVVLSAAAGPVFAQPPEAMQPFSNGQPAQTPSQPDVIITYTYQPDAARLLTDYRRVWTRVHPGMAITRGALANEAAKAFAAANTTNSAVLSDDTPDASPWSLVGPIHPWMVVPVVAVKNATEDAWLNVTVKAETLAQVGEWLVDDALYLTDDAHRLASGQWVRASETTWQLPALVPGQRQEWPAPPVNILALLEAVSEPEQPSHWINMVLVRITVTAHNLPAQQTEQPLTLTPDYFAVPYWY